MTYAEPPPPTVCRHCWQAIQETLFPDTWIHTDTLSIECEKRAQPFDDSRTCRHCGKWITQEDDWIHDDTRHAECEKEVEDQ